MSTDIYVPHRVWGYAESAHSEEWGGAFDTRENAIESGREVFKNCGTTFWIVEGEYTDPAEYFSMERIVEDAQEQVYEDEVDECEIRLTAEAANEMQAVLTAWARKHVSLTRWKTCGTPEEVTLVEPVDVASDG